MLEPMGMFRPMVRNLALKRAYRRLFGESVARGAAWLVATSVQEEKELIEEGIPPRKISVRRNGIELSQPSGAAGDLRRKYGISRRHSLCCFWAGSWKRKVRTC